MLVRIAYRHILGRVYLPNEWILVDLHTEGGEDEHRHHLPDENLVKEIL